MRTADAHAVCDLALHNYREMASGVISRGYRFRKAVEDALYKHARWTGIIPLYTMVSFGSMRYSDIRKKWVRQGKVLQIAAWISGITALLATGYLGKKLLRHR